MILITCKHDDSEKIFAWYQSYSIRPEVTEFVVDSICEKCKDSLVETFKRINEEKK